MSNAPEPSDSARIDGALQGLSAPERILFGAMLQRRWRARLEETSYEIDLYGARRVANEALAALWRSLGLAVLLLAIVLGVSGHWGHVHALVVIGIAGAAVAILCGFVSGRRARTVHRTPNEGR